MPGAAALPELWRPWADLPLDLLRDISRRLHATTDYVRFHATCKPWRDTLPPAPCQTAFLPWLLSPPGSTKHRKARCVFSCSKSTRHGTGGAATEIGFRDQRWVISLVDGNAVFTLTTPGGGLTVDLTGSAASAWVTPVPPLLLSSEDVNNETKWWVDHATDGVVFSDGTILLYFIGPVYRKIYVRPFNAALLRPGDAAWTPVHTQYFSVDTCSSVAHYDGKIIIRSTCSTMFGQVDDDTQNWPTERGKALEASYLLEFRGELLLANVLGNYFPHDITSFVLRSR